MDHDFEQKLLCLRRREPRFTVEAYLFVFEALEFTIQRLGKDQNTGVERHITGRELLDGARLLAREQFGPLSRHVLNTWGFHRTEDIGEAVFLLVSESLLKKRESDSMADFTSGYDFREAFERDYQIDLSHG